MLFDKHTAVKHRSRIMVLPRQDD